LLVVLGLAVTVWLALVPAASTLNGSGCGVPLIEIQDDARISAGRVSDCGKRNQTRITQACWTLALAGITAGVEWGVRRRREPAPEVANPRSYYE
jgi:hypothetical protein